MKFVKGVPFLFLFACVEEEQPVEVSESVQEAGDQNARALQSWAGDAPLVAVATVVSVETTADGPVFTSEVTLQVDELVRQEEGAVSRGDLLILNLPGGQIGEETMVSSEAPIFFEDDSVLIQLDSTGTELWNRNQSVLAWRDGAAQICVNPAREALPDCVDQGFSLLFLDGVEQRTEARASIALPELPQALVIGSAMPNR